MNASQFVLNPTLVGKLVSIRPLCTDDFDNLYECASDPKIWEQHPQKNRYEKPIFQKFFDDAINSKGAFAIIDIQSSEIIGSSRYYNLDVIKEQITIGYTFLSRKYWGGIYNRELKLLMLEHAFSFVESVQFEIGSYNKRSRRAIEKIGASLNDELALDGKDHVIYIIKRSQLKELASLK
ncbi:MAG: GNAT family N-acetyltransferase [Oligoflexia bacterium]|nr:GNAT family N-acetyltransferase [Oligoflexia bacterium]